MENLIHEINGIKYLLVEVPIISKTARKIERRCKRYGCITQGVKEVKRGGLFYDTIIVAKILVPEKNVIDFDNDDN